MITLLQKPATAILSDVSNSAVTRLEKSSPADIKLSYRPIETEDNAAIKKIILNCYKEFGYASDDTMIGKLSETYKAPGSEYWVLVDAENKIYGGCGFTKKDVPDAKVCIIQKFYFAPEARKYGFGKILLKHILQRAAETYDQAELVTGITMQGAQTLYTKCGFTLAPSLSVDPNYKMPANPELAFVGFKRSLSDLKKTVNLAANRHSQWSKSTSTQSICPHVTPEFNVSTPSDCMLTTKKQHGNN